MRLKLERPPLLALLSLALLTGGLVFGPGFTAPARAADAKPETDLYLRATVSAPVSQDVLDITLSAEATATDPVAAQSAVNRRMSEALALLRTVTTGKERGTLEYATGNYTMWSEPASPPARPASPPHERVQPPHWRAAQSLSLKGTDVADLLKAMGELQKKGLITQSLHFESSDAKTRAATDDATTRAVLRLREEAGKIAASLGMKVASIHDLRVEGTVPPRPLYAAMARSASAGFTPPVASPGAAAVHVSVNGTFILHPVAH